MEPNEATSEAISGFGLMMNSNLAQHQMELQAAQEEHFREMGTAEQAHQHAIARAELALKAYRHYRSDGVPTDGELVTRDEVRAVLLAALKLPSED